MSFHRFDALAQNDFWTAPIEDINRGLEKNTQKDMQKQSGISLVIGCPLPEEVQSALAALEAQIDSTIAEHNSSMRVRWRTDLSALHMTVYGVVLPQDYNESSWSFVESQKHALEECLARHSGFTLELEGIGILGRGAVSVRVSDSDALEALRDDISHLEGVSRERFGSRTSKIVLGRVLPGITNADRDALKEVCTSLKTTSLGSITVDTLQLVQYEHTFLDARKDSISISV